MKYPNLFKFFSKHIGVPASTALIESFFSIVGSKINNKNGRLLIETLADRAFLKANMNLISDF